MRKQIISIENYSVEDFAQLIIEKKATFTTLKEEINTCQFGEEIKQVLLQRLEWANERIHKSLDFNELLFYTIIPLGIIHSLSKQYFFDVEEELKHGFKRRVNQYYIYSILGVFMYLLLFIISIFINLPK